MDAAFIGLHQLSRGALPGSRAACTLTRDEALLVTEPGAHLSEPTEPTDSAGTAFPPVPAGLTNPGQGKIHHVPCPPRNEPFGPA